MHKQIDVVAMASPLGPALADVFVGFCEYELFSNIKISLLSHRSIDDTFVEFNKEKNCKEFFIYLNSPHPLLRFTFQKECDNCLSFLNFLNKRCLIFHAKPSEEQKRSSRRQMTNFSRKIKRRAKKKVITSANVQFSRQNQVKSKKKVITSARCQIFQAKAGVEQKKKSSVPQKKKRT